MKSRINSFLMFSGVWLFFALLALFLNFVKSEDKDVCTERVKATVIAIEPVTISQSNDEYKVSESVPILEYTYKGVTYQSHSENSSWLSSSNLKVGDTVVIYLDPDNPEHIRLETEDRDIHFTSIIIKVCIGLEVFNLLLFIIDIIRIKKNKKPILVTLN